ncbi:MAG: class I SAM-dependent methyltransferase [Acidobacteria bacterium]|nr:MAG: class I SAM-dependent methyltransferase [Acidobacteriota bacterium]REK03838.1 MAG: class I SAM-dependent methyltransferase [Acidobacteriota bacterium]
MARPDRDPVAAMESEYSLPVHWFPKTRIAAAGRREKQRLVMEMLRAFDHGQPIDHLDVGCGDGRWTADIKDRLRNPRRCCGVDRSRRAIGFATLIRPDIDFQVAQGEQLPFEDDSFDLVSAVEVLEHVEDGAEERFLAQIARVLRPGGRLLLTTPSHLVPLPATHFRHYTQERLGQLIEGAGFEIAVWRGHGIPVGAAVWRLVLWCNEFPLLWKLGRFRYAEASPGRTANHVLLARLSGTGGESAR